MPTPSSSSEEKHLPDLPAPTLPDIPSAQPTTIAPTQPSNYIYFTVFDSKIPDIDDVQPVPAVDPSNLSTTPSHVLLNDVHWKDVHLKDVRLKVPQVEETTVDGTAAKDLASLMTVKPNESHVVMIKNSHHLIYSNTPFSQTLTPPSLLNTLTHPLTDPNTPSHILQHPLLSP